MQIYLRVVSTSNVVVCFGNGVKLINKLPSLISDQVIGTTKLTHHLYIHVYIYIYNSNFIQTNNIYI